MLRPIDPSCAASELRRVERLIQPSGEPLALLHLRRVVAEGWLTHNPELFWLYETDGRLRGFLGLLPLRPESYRALLISGGHPLREVAKGDVLPAGAAQRARLEGMYVWLQGFRYATPALATVLASALFARLAETNLKGLLAAPSGMLAEADCRWLGLVERTTRPGRRIWYADEATICDPSEHPLGRPVPLTAIFLHVRDRFDHDSRRLRLSPTQRRIARLFYLEELTESQVASRLDMPLDTVKTHLHRIRTKAESVVGSRVSRGIAAWLQRHPAELTE